MSNQDSSRKPTASKSAKPAKPYDTFPLTAHPSGLWCKKIRGRLVYFGPWARRENGKLVRVEADGWQAALDEYNRQADALHAGRKPREETTGTLKELANKFLNDKRALVASGELTQRSWDDYHAACDLLLGYFGATRLVADLDPEDFAGLRRKLTAKGPKPTARGRRPAAAKGPKRTGKPWASVTLRNTMQRIRSVFKYAFDSGMIDRPVRYGQGFNRPSEKTLRVERARQGAKLFQAEEIRRMLDAAGVPLRAMILLGINAGFGNSDCGRLPLDAADLDGAVIDFPRPKTGIPRRCPLWPETVEALRAALAKRPTPERPEFARLFFITKRGLSWAKETADNPLTWETRKLMNELGINGHRNFYTLRHTHRTIADEAKDQPAADRIMGHESSHMSTVYRETISDARLRAVTDHVRGWLFPVDATSGRKPATGDKSALRVFAR